MDVLNHLIDGIEEQVKLEHTRIESHINVRISELQSAKTTSDDEELKLIETRINELNLIKKRLQQEWKSKRTQASERHTRIFGNGGYNPPDRIMKLQFRNGISESIFTGEKFSLEVELVDPMTNNIVEMGQESSAKFDIVVLNGGVEDDLTGEAFKDKIVPEMEGKEPLLRENPQVKLQRGKTPLDKISLKLRRGKASLDKISFKHNRSNTKQQQIRLVARITNQFFDGVRVKEAMTETFTVKDFRGKYGKKRDNPLLSDEVFRLTNIARRGKIVKALKNNNIVTVEDFLIQFLRNSERLKRIVNLGGQKKWDAIVNNARACQNDGKMYCYINHERKTGVVFNVLGEVLQLYFINQYATTAVLPENHQDLARELLSSARIHWEDVRTIYDKNALEEYLISKSSSKPKRWRKLLHVFKVFSITEKHSFGGSKRHYAPCFDDEVWGPENVNIDENIPTELIEDPETLRHIMLMTETPERWETIANHARTCTLSDTPTVLSEIHQPENGIISSHHSKNFWNDPNYFLPEY